MGAQHTPGPWRISSWSGAEAFVEARNPATGKPMHVTMTAMRRDAQLIAAAPDLLASLTECADDLEAEIEARRSGELSRRINRDLETVARARLIIARATGAA